MKLGWSGLTYSHRKSRLLLSASSFLLVVALNNVVDAQNVATTTLNVLSLTDVPTMSRSTSLSTTRPPKSMITSITTSTTSNTTSPTSTHTTNALAPPLGIPPASNGSDPTTRRRESVFNYYFLFLAAFGVLVALSLWWLHRQRKRRKELMRLSGQDALARDLDGWVNSRRWIYGRWRHNQTTAFVRREEGLDENGEAPPPYEPKGETTVSQTNVSPVHEATSSITIPLRALSRDEIEMARPPEYLALEANGTRRNSNPSNTDVTQTTRSDTAGTYSSTSTRDVIRHGSRPSRDRTFTP